MRNTHQHTYPSHSSRRKSRCPFHFPFITLICAGTLNASADFTPYAVIIERAIFGRPPVRVDKPAAAVDAAEQRAAEALARKITMCAVNRTPSGYTAVGLIDNETKPPRNFYLNVGDTDGGLTILAADYDAETAVIEKDGVTITLQLGKGLIGIGTESAAELLAAAAPPPSGSTNPNRPFSQLVPLLPGGDTVPIPSEPPMPPMLVEEPLELRPDGRPRVPEGIRRAHQERRAHIAAGGTEASYMEMLKERRENQERQRREELQKQRKEVLELAEQAGIEAAALREREINLQRIEQGMAPLSPIQLTAEEEDYLIEKGALAP